MGIFMEFINLVNSCFGVTLYMFNEIQLKFDM